MLTTRGLEQRAVQPPPEDGAATRPTGGGGRSPTGAELQRHGRHGAGRATRSQQGSGTGAGERRPSRGRSHSRGDAGLREARTAVEPRRSNRGPRGSAVGGKAAGETRRGQGQAGSGRILAAAASTGRGGGARGEQIGGSGVR